MVGPFGFFPPYVGAQRPRQPIAPRQLAVRQRHQHLTIGILWPALDGLTLCAVFSEIRFQPYHQQP